MILETTYTKDADERLDYLLDFTDLLQSGEVIASHTVIASDAAVLHSSVLGTKAVTVWLHAGTPGQSYTVTVRVTTNSAPTARIFERSFGLGITS